ncbi:hypothetical protein [Deinococcus yunweiensis]
MTVQNARHNPEFEYPFALIQLVPTDTCRTLPVTPTTHSGHV